MNFLFNEQIGNNLAISNVEQKVLSKGGKKASVISEYSEPVSEVKSKKKGPKQKVVEVVAEEPAVVPVQEGLMDFAMLMAVQQEAKAKEKVDDSMLITKKGGPKKRKGKGWTPLEHPNALPKGTVDYNNVFY